MALEYIDIVALSRAEGRQLKLDPSYGVLVEDPGTLPRLIDAGLITKNGSLTDKGATMHEQIQGRERLLQKGIPAKRRNRLEPKAILSGDYRWATGQVSNQPIVTNGELICVGKPVAAMKAEQAPPDVRKKFPKTIASCLKGDFEQLWPHVYQVKKLGELEMIWMANADQKIRIPVQVKYFDFLADKFPKGLWFGIDDMNPVQLRVKNRGLKDNVVGLLMPFALQGVLELPAKLEDWPE